MDFTHLDNSGNIAMVDVSGKPGTLRTARASGYILMQPETIELLSRDALPKGNVLTTAKLAGIMAAKNTAHLIPLCHQLNLSVQHQKEKLFFPFLAILFLLWFVLLSIAFLRLIFCRTLLQRLPFRQFWSNHFRPIKSGTVFFPERCGLKEAGFCARYLQKLNLT